MHLVGAMGAVWLAVMVLAGRGELVSSPATVHTEPVPPVEESHGRHRWEDRAAAPAIPAGTKEAPTPITEPITAPAQPGNGGKR